MFRDMIMQLLELIANPKEAWSNIVKGSQEKEQFLNKMFYPLLGITALSQFWNCVDFSDFNIQEVLQVTVVATMKFFLGYVLTVFLLNNLLPKMMGWSVERCKKTLDLYVGYLVCVLMATQIFINIMPSYNFLKFLPFYTIYVLWMGCIYYLKVEEERNQRILFSALASVILFLSLGVIERVMTLFMPGFSGI